MKIDTHIFQTERSRVHIKLIDFGSAAYIKSGPFDVFVGTIGTFLFRFSVCDNCTNNLQTTPPPKS